LALQGGEPVRKTRLPYGHQWIDREDIQAAAGALQTEWITQGPAVEKFEKAVAEYTGVRYAVAISSGTAALHAACAAAGLRSGDEAVTSPLSFVATANAVVYCGAKPVFADIDEETLTINPGEIKKKISPSTKALLTVDFAGHPCQADEIREIARERNLIVIEDAAHALGARYKEKIIGGQADMTVLSFHPVKHITTGEGGMVLTNEAEFYEKLKRFRHHGITLNPSEGPWAYDIGELGYNFRITDFQCALGLRQLTKLDSFVKRRRTIAERYTEAFGLRPEIKIPTAAKWAGHAYHLYVIQLNLDQLSCSRREIFEALRAENIGVQVHYVPVHFFRYYQDHFDCRAKQYPVTERYYEKAITLPLFPKMSDDDAADVIKAVSKILDYYTVQSKGKG